MDKELSKELKVRIGEVIKSVGYYEKGFSSTKRTPVGDKERSESLSQYIECRLNFELFRVQKLRELEEMMDGHLFKVTNVDGEDGRKFESVSLTLDSKPIHLTDMEYNLVSMKLFEVIGGNSMKFGNKWRKPNIEVSMINEEDEPLI